MDAKQAWQAALDRIRLRISPGAFTTWFRETSGVELRQGCLVVGVRNTFASEHLSQRFHEMARVAVSEVVGQSMRISFTVCPPPPPLPDAPDTHAVALAQRPPAGRRAPLAQRVALAPRAPARPRTSGQLGGMERPRHDGVAQPPLLDLPTAPPRSPSPTSGGGASALPRPLAATPVPLLVREPDVPTEAHEPHPGYHFESFVVGTANRLAYTAALEVAHAPGERYNPLLIYGGVGLGKTHLLHAIGHHVREQGLTLAYVTAERFTNEIIEAIRQRTTNEFRQRYRAVDVLLVDDVQFIAGKDSTEEEFFHTFNALHEKNKQIVLSSDRVPNAMSHLHDRLRSRFAWGLIADITPPDFAHRLEILRMKAAARQVTVADDVLALLARPECESIRALEGALTRVVAYAGLLRQPLDVALASRALASLASERAVGRPVEIAEVLAAVARRYEVSEEELRSKTRRPQVVWARQVAMYLLREETAHSLFQIGAALGGRDHSTVLHGCAKVSATLAHSAMKRAEIEAIRGSLRP
ncbi:MAG: chromosomal replication initiator protein DnaA [Ktedonobacterales bacterium]|nr:chromosomal replication initiator protein DnaA [Ktedonobacterales bacterium]